MKRLLSVIVVFCLLAATSVVGSASPGTHRIALPAAGAAAAGLTVRHELLNGRVSADVTDVQLALLDRVGIAYDLVPMRSVAPLELSLDQLAASTGLRLMVPSTQVPYGIKMIYGNPSLTPAGISGGSGVTVAVLDTGSVNHLDFTRANGSKVITQCVDFSGALPQVEGSCNDGHGHGTHVTGTIAAAGGRDGRGIYGVAPGATVYSYKVLTDAGVGFSDDISLAIRVAADRGADIISMSLGSDTPAQDELDAIRYAAGKGVLVIAAAGNSGPNANTIGFPGGFAEAVAVAALNPDEVVADFSSRGISDGDDLTVVDREVEVAGPGRDTISTYFTGGYTSMSGTSMATPHIAGLAAKMWQGSASATRNWLVSAAKAHDITAAQGVNNAGPGYDIASGHGLPQVNNLQQSLWVD